MSESTPAPESPLAHAAHTVSDAVHHGAEVVHDAFAAAGQKAHDLFAQAQKLSPELLAILPDVLEVLAALPPLPAGTLTLASVKTAATIAAEIAAVGKPGAALIQEIHRRCPVTVSGVEPVSPS